MHTSKKNEHIGKEQLQIHEGHRYCEGFYQSLIQSAPDVILFLSLDHRILEFNPEAERLFGCKRANVIGKDYFELFLPADVQKVVEQDIKKVLAGEPTKEF